MKLSVLVPVYNEEATLSRILRQVLELPLELEVLILDDGSTDRTWEILKTLEAPTVRIFRHKSNRGKGAALRTLIPEARGDFVVIQDGDLEYDPADLVRMLREAEEHQAPVIYGNRAHGRRFIVCNHRAKGHRVACGRVGAGCFKGDHFVPGVLDGYVSAS